MFTPNDLNIDHYYQIQTLTQYTMKDQLHTNVRINKIKESYNELNYG